MNSTRKHILGSFILQFALLGILPIQAAVATSVDISVDTSSLSGTPAQLAFDLIDGDFVVNNTTTISSFTTDGILGLASSIGDVSGALPGSVTLGDTDFFNEYLQDITLGTSLSFSLDLSEENAGGFFPDQFSFFILDAFFLPLFSTSDPTGADALFAIDITGLPSGDVQNFSPRSSPSASWTASPVAPIPIPSTWLLLGTGLALMLVAMHRQNSLVYMAPQ